MIIVGHENYDIMLRTGVRLVFADLEAFFASVTGSEKLSIPETLVRRCGLLNDICDQDCEAQDDIMLQLSMEDVKSWLICAKLDDAAELARTDQHTLLRALKVSRPRRQRQRPRLLLNSRHCDDHARKLESWSRLRCDGV